MRNLDVVASQLVRDAHDCGETKLSMRAIIDDLSEEGYDKGAINGIIKRVASSAKPLGIRLAA